MKKLYASFLFCILGFTSFAQEKTTPALSAHTRALIKQLETSTNKEALFRAIPHRTLADGKLYISALIKISNAALADRNLQNLGVKIGTKAKDIWTVQIPTEKVLQFVKTQGISCIELDQPAFPRLDLARIKTKVDSVHGGYNLPMKYTGKDVVMGVIDFGFDYNHPTFYDSTGTQFRISKAWELGSVGTPPTGYSYGHELVDANAIKAASTDNAVQTHGTAVAGITSGSGRGGNATNPALFRGISYEAEMVFVGVRRDTLGNQWMHGTFTDFVDGINYIFNYASSVSKPAVVNISWGSQSGAHDGTSLFNQACNNLSGPGKMIVMSAGNEGSDKIHFNKTFSATDTLSSSFITFSSNVYQRTWIDSWGEPTKNFCASITLYNNGILGNTTDFLCADNNSHNLYIISSNGLDTCYVDVRTSSSEINNNKPHIFLNVFNKSTDSIVITFKANDGTVHAWNESYFYGYVQRYSSQFEKLGISWADDGNTNYTTSEMGNADSVLLVGAWMTKKAWYSINGSTPSFPGTFDSIAIFSSLGPSADGRIRPDIAAPGFGVASAVSSFDASYTATGSNSTYVISGFQEPSSGKTYYYYMFSGTSASSPVAAGIVGLLMQAKPDLQPYQIKNLLYETATIDKYTGSVPNNIWGHGKINAYGAMRKLAQQTGVYNYHGKKLDCVLYPNPNKGAFSLDYFGDKTENLTLTIVDVKGSVIYTEIWKVNSGYNQRSLDLNHLSKGIYFVKINSNSGSVNIKALIQ